jgi:ribulose 1,5-bisphosphate synthetase/thiazole synthase
MRAHQKPKETPTRSIIVAMSDLEATENAYPRAQVIIVGAGPVGLFLALKIAQQGIKTMVIEAEAEIVPSPRATA